MGHTETETNSCGAIANQQNEAHAIYVKPGKTPVFYRETFVRSYERSAAWKKSGSLERIYLDEDEIEYRRLK
jgi:hypothetical protein